MIDIVLATFNGERFLTEQVSSIQKNHSYGEKVARIIIVDDGSTDDTKNIVQLLAASDPKIEWIRNTSALHGPSNNFSFGLSLTTSKYIMLCDQDDIWLPEKIETSFSHIQILEEALDKKSSNLPLLVFSDKFIVSDALELISNSYFSLKNIPFDWHHKFHHLCQQNVASGCTMLFNRELLEKALPIPKQAYMHDWWLILVANRCGKVKLIEQPLIQYRQHEKNSIGARRVSKWNLLRYFNSHLAKFEQSFLQTVEQAKAFREFEIKQQLTESDCLSALAYIEHTSRVKRLKLFMNNKITRSHFFGKVALLIVLLKLKVKR